MILEQYYLACLAHASYLIADEETATAAIVDPQRDIGRYLEDTKRRGLTIRHVLLTHLHADFVAGHVELRERCGATIHLGAKATVDYPYRPLADGETLEFGKVRLKILETPGHTPEGISILVFDLDKDESKPHAVLTGDTLFVGDVGRPDLMASIGMTAEELAGMLYDSLHTKLMALPDETLVYPAHGAGSLCGKNLSTETVSTIGEQRRLNEALQPMSREEFIAKVTKDQPDAPAYFTYDAQMNRKERPTLDEALEESLKPLAVEDVLRMINAGAQVLDVRGADAFAAGHLEGAVNIGLDGKFASWTGTILSRENPIVIIAEPGREQEAALRLGRIGFDHVAGYLQRGMKALERRPELIRAAERVTAEELAGLLASPAAPILLDVRAPRECRDATIGESLHIPLNRLEGRLAEIPADRPVVVCCASGYRSSIAASLLRKHGRTGVRDLIGGFEAWQAEQHATNTATRNPSKQTGATDG